MTINCSPNVSIGIRSRRRWSRAAATVEDNQAWPAATASSGLSLQSALAPRSPVNIFPSAFTMQCIERMDGRFQLRSAAGEVGEQDFSLLSGSSITQVLTAGAQSVVICGVFDMVQGLG